MGGRGLGMGDGVELSLLVVRYGGKGEESKLAVLWVPCISCQPTASWTGEA